MSYDLPPNGVEKPKSGGIDIDIKRVLARVIKFWYLIVLSTAIALTIAHFVNRYSDRVYPIQASVIILQNDENAGADFLYDNALANPFRNFYNEIYIMRSYPLLTTVMEELNFDVSYFREGSIKTTEYYDPDFPIEIKMLGANKPYGKSVNFRIIDNSTYSLDLLFDDNTIKTKKFPNLHFNDTIKINGFSLIVKRKGNLESLHGKLFMVQFNDPFNLARSYSYRLKINWAQLGASVVNLEVNGQVPQKEIKFLNKFIEKYQEYDVEKKNKMATMAIRFLNSQLHYMRDSLNLLEDRVESFKHRNVITNMGSETNRLFNKIQVMEEQKFNYRLKENYYDYIINILKKDDYEGVFTPTSVGVSDNIISGLITSLISARAQLNRYQGIEKKKENPLYQEQVLQMNQIKSDILKTIENSRKTESISFSFMDEQLKEINRELNKLPGTEREFVDIQRDYSLKESLYVFLLQKRTEASLSKASTTSDIVVVNPPLTGGAVSPKEDQNYLMALAVGLFLPLAGFVLAELLNNRLQSREDIQKITTVPIIGAIGHNLSDDQMIVFNKPRSAMAESFRAIRSNLNYFTGGKDSLVFMVTSSLPGDGKSFTALNLASVFAMAGKKTVIVGADLRRPKLYDALKLHNDFGLSQYLSGLMKADQIIQQSNIDNLSLISGGPQPPNPSELLLRPAMTDLIAMLKTQFAYIIIDTPPLSFVADAFVLANYADHSVFVVRQDFTPKAALQTLEEYYQEGKLKSISILFNDLRKSGMGYGYYNYGYGYSGYSYYKGKKVSGSEYYQE